MLILVTLLVLALQAAGDQHTVSVEIVESGGRLEAGQSYNLTCNVSDPTDITSYQWNMEDEPLHETDKVLSFPSLGLSDVGTYTCQVMNLTWTIGISSNWTIILPIIDMITVTSNETNPIHFFGSSITLICTVKLSPVAETLKPEVNIEWVPIPMALLENELPIFENSNGACTNIGHETRNNIILQCEDNTYKSIVIVNPFTPGFYNCTATIIVTGHQYYASMELSNTTRFTSGVYLSLDGRILPNGSAIAYTEITFVTDKREGTRSRSLICNTDRIGCCETEGNWYMVNGSVITDVSQEFGVIRNIDGTGTVTLFRNQYRIISIFSTLCCTVPDARNINQTVCVNSDFSVYIAEEATPVMGQNYTLTCNASRETRGNITYRWKRGSTDLHEMTSTLFIPAINLSHAGIYSCIVNDNYTASVEVPMQIPAPASVNLFSNNPTRAIGSDVNLTCSVQLNASAVMAIDLSLLMVDIDIHRNQIPFNQRSELTTMDTNITYTTQLHPFERNHSGIYTCTATVSSTVSYLTVSDPVTDSTKISTGVYFSLCGVSYSNNSNISFEMIGEERDEALLCLTDFYQFFNESDNTRNIGRWYFFNGSNKLSVSTDMNNDIYMTSNLGVGVIRLHRKNTGINSLPTGFWCQILDSNNISQRIYITVYYNENMSTTSFSLASDPDSSHTGTEPRYEDSSSPIDSSSPTESSSPTPTSCCNTAEADSKVSAAVIGGAGVGGMLLIVTITVGVILVVFLIKRGRRKQKNQLHHTRRFSEPIEAIDSTKLPPEPDIDKGECIELNESDEIQANEGNEDSFIDTTLTDGECMKPIPLSEFCPYVEQMHANRDKLFETEYTRLSRLPKFCTSEAKLSHNMPKNRFANILPYDCSRVKLTEIEGEQGSDYINANYLDGYNKPNAYIAAQGPLPNTVGDFWRMVWEKKLSTIAMLTRCFEGRPKCEEYWPVNAGESIQPGHNLTITLKAMLPFAEYSVRKMTVTCVQSSEGCEGSSNTDRSNSLEVVQFHFTGWPDHGVPQNGVVLINFIWRIRTIHPYSDPCPLLVHCSAGVGRTGAFIVLDSMLERMKEEDNLNIFEFLKQLRAQRVLMVQTQAQYNFIHDVLNELILTGNTEITAPNFRIIMNRLNKVKDGENGYSKQFKILDQVSPTPRVFDCTQANMKFNAEKNRYPHIKPNDRHRVMLREEIGSGQDYINASFINGYRQRGTYIATQVPMENTVNDFWKMIWEYKSTTIVLLCKMTEEGEVYPDFLPDSKGGCMMYGKVEVKFVSQQVSPDYVVKHLEISEVKGADTLDTMTITLFHYLRWPKNGGPQRSASLLEIIELVNKKQMGSGNKAITVMCNDGVGRTGAFICIHTQMERMKTEGVVDFFQCIKSARIQRAGLVPDVDQYVLCHTVVADYLNDFDAYANFKDLI